MIDPYRRLAKVAGFRGVDATLSKRDGTTLALRVKAERIDDERLDGSYPNSMRVRAWSANLSDFVKEDGSTAMPADGDRLHVPCRDGKERVFLTAKDSSTSRYWDWR